MAHNIPKRNSNRWRTCRGIGVALLMFGSMSGAAYADEGGVSFWLPGQFGSLAAAPAVPGWSGAVIYYHTTVGASGAVAAARQIQIGRIPATAAVSLNANLNAQADLAFLNSTYTFATPVHGGQLAIGMTGLFGRSSARIDGTLTGPLGVTRTGFIGDSITSVGDLYPMATLKWNAGVHNYMTYVTGDIPVGAYDPSRLANLGIGHAAIDGGGGYTYFNPATGHNSPRLRVSPTILGITTRIIRTGSTSMSTGACRSSFRSRFSLVSWDMDINRSPTILVSTLSSAVSGRASSALVRRSATCSRSGTCRDIST
jgi:hypothetical protein